MADEKKEAYEFSVAGFKLKLNNTMIAMAIPIITTVGGAMWGAFEFYKDYMDMRSKIAKYVAPDLSNFDKRLAVIEENSQKTSDYTRDIKNDLKADLRKLEGVVEQVERAGKQTQREVGETMSNVQKELRTTQREVSDSQKRVEGAITQVQRDLDKDLRTVRKEVDDKIKKAIDNPLAK